MNKYFENKKWLIILITLVFNLIIMLTFYDVFRGREFYLDIKNTVGIVIAMISAGLLIHFLSKSKKDNCTESNIILLILSTVIFSLLLQKFILKTDYFNVSGDIFENPLYTKFERIAIENNLDLAYTKNTWIDNSPVSYKKSGLYLEEPKSIDILFFGDSTIAWGFIPGVVEQMTGKKVGVYAFESNLLTAKTSQLFNRIAKYYLKNDGIAIFCFDNWTKSQSPNSVNISQKDFDEMASWSDEKFKQYVIQYRIQTLALNQIQKTHDTDQNKSFAQAVNPTVNSNSASINNSNYSFAIYQKTHDEIINNLKENYHLQLKSPHLYFDYIEPILNPIIHKAKMQNQNKDTLHIRWDYNSLTHFNPNFEDISIHSNSSSFTNLNDTNIKLNALEASKIRVAKKIYVVPLFTKESSYKESRDIYQTYYKNLEFDLCDLGTIQAYENGYEMQSRAHMGNTGGLMQSILFAKWLQKQLSNK